MYLYIGACVCTMLSAKIYNESEARSYIDRIVSVSKQPQEIKSRLASLAGEGFKKLSSAQKTFTSESIHKLFIDAISTVKKERSKTPPVSPRPPSFEVEKTKPKPAPVLTGEPADTDPNKIDTLTQEIRRLKNIKRAFDWWGREMAYNKGVGTNQTKEVLKKALDESAQLSSIVLPSDPKKIGYNGAQQSITKMMKRRAARTRAAVGEVAHYVTNRLLDRYNEIAQSLSTFAPKEIDLNLTIQNPLSPDPTTVRPPVPPRKGAPNAPTPPAPPKLPTSGGRQDLLSDIRKGTTLSPSDQRPIPPAPPEPPTLLDQIKNPGTLTHVTDEQKVKAEHSKNPLLEQIRAGTELKHVDKGDINTHQKNTKKKGGILGTLANVFKKKFGKARGEETDPETSWDEEDEE